MVGLRAELAELTARLEDAEADLERLRITPETVAEVLAEMDRPEPVVPEHGPQPATVDDRAGGPAMVSAYAGAERRVVGVIEGTRAKLKRLVERGWLDEDAPGLFIPSHRRRVDSSNSPQKKGSSPYIRRCQPNRTRREDPWDGRYDTAATADPFARSIDAFETLVGNLSGDQAHEWTHAELEEQLDVAGRDLLRQLLQDRLDLRARREEGPGPAPVPGRSWSARRCGCGPGMNQATRAGWPACSGWSASPGAPTGAPAPAMSTPPTPRFPCPPTGTR